MRSTPFVVAVVWLTFAAPAHAARCVGTTQYGDAVATANNFHVHGIGCHAALVSAASYLDSYNAEKGLDAVQLREAKVTIRFVDAHRKWSCQLQELPSREQHPKGSYEGWRYKCRAGSAQMSFKWWNLPGRPCPTNGLFEGLIVTRNAPCPKEDELEPKEPYETRAGTSFYETGEPPEKHYYQWFKRFYHFSDLLCVSEGSIEGPHANKLTWNCVEQHVSSPAAYSWREPNV